MEGRHEGRRDSYLTGTESGWKETSKARQGKRRKNKEITRYLKEIDLMKSEISQVRTHVTVKEEGK